MRILHIIYDDVKNPWCGGGGALRAKIINEYLAINHNITVITGNYPGAKDEVINKVRFIRIGVKGSYILSRISFIFLVPLYLNFYKSDIVINDCSFFAPCFISLYTRRKNINIIHHLMEEHAFKLYRIVGWIPFINEKIILKLAWNIITPSEKVKQKIKIRYPDKNVVNIPNGISQELLSLESKKDKYILFLGRIDVYMKGIDVLIRSFSRIKDNEIILKIAGSGKKSDEKKLINLIKKIGIEKKVEVLGRVNEDKKMALLRDCLFLAMPSRFEGWGITALEANASGKAVVGTDIDGLSEAVVSDKTAILVEPENSDQLAATMEELINNADLRSSLGIEGRKWAHNFIWKNIAKKQFDFYVSIIRD